MNKHFPVVLLLLVLVFTAACKRDTIPTVSEKDLKELNIRPTTFKYLTTRSKVNFDDGKQRLGATANIRISSDSLIWVSITPGLGIEVARALVTRDSLFLVNKLEKTYYAYSFAELSRKLNVVVDYDILQAALLGDPIAPVSTSNRIRRTPQETIVLQQQQGYDIINHFANETLKLTRVVVQEPQSPGNLVLQYGNFQTVDGNILPLSSTITARYQENQQLKATEIAFEHNKAEFSDKPLSFPFSIPDRYARKQ